MQIAGWLAKAESQTLSVSRVARPEEPAAAAAAPAQATAAAPPVSVSPSSSSSVAAPATPAQPAPPPDPVLSFLMLRNSFPEMVKETLLDSFLPEKYGFCSWRADDVHGIVYGWADEVELYVAQSETDTVIIYAAMSATRSDVCTTERQVKLYGLSANDQRFVHASIITLACPPEVLQFAEEKGIEMILVKRAPAFVPDNVHLSEPLLLDTLAVPPRRPSREEQGMKKEQRAFVLFFEAAGMAAEEAANYASIFDAQRVGYADMKYLSLELLSEMGVKMGHGLKIMKLINLNNQQTAAPRR